MGMNKMRNENGLQKQLTPVEGYQLDVILITVHIVPVFKKFTGPVLLRPSLFDLNHQSATMTKHLSLDLQVPFNTEREAEIACRTMSVDPEPKRGGCKKSMTVEDTTLHVHFDALQAKSLRVGVNSFFDHLSLVVKTIDQFGPPRPLDSS